MNRRLARIELGTGEHPYTLYFRADYDRKARTRMSRDIGDGATPDPVIVRVKKAILAMPRRSLELIDSRFFDDPWLKDNLPSVLVQSAFKLFLAYERPWWRALGSGGRPFRDRSSASPNLLLRHGGRSEGREAVVQLFADGLLQRHRHVAVLEGP